MYSVNKCLILSCHATCWWVIYLSHWKRKIKVNRLSQEYMQSFSSAYGDSIISIFIFESRQTVEMNRRGTHLSPSQIVMWNSIWITISCYFPSSANPQYSSLAFIHNCITILGWNIWNNLNGMNDYRWILYQWKICGIPKVNAQPEQRGLLSEKRRRLEPPERSLFRLFEKWKFRLYQ
jgi:hypothetical protein